MNLIITAIKQTQKRSHQISRLIGLQQFNLERSQVHLHTLPRFSFSRFGSSEKKIEELSKQLNTYARKNNYKQMIMTQIKIIKQKEKKESMEFYTDFIVDYRKLCEFLIKKREYEEAITLYEDCITHYSKKIEIYSQKQGQDKVEGDEHSIQEYQKDLSELINLKLDLANIHLMDPSKNVDTAFEMIEELKESVLAESMTCSQQIRLKLLESRLYFKTYEIKESLKIISETDDIIKGNNDYEKDESIEKYILQVEIIIQKIKSQVELQQIDAAEKNIKICEEIIAKHNIQNINSQLCIEFYHHCLEICEYTAHFDKAQTIILQIDQILEDSENQDPAYQAIVYYYDSLVMNQIGNQFESAQSLISCFNNLEKAINCEHELVWKALNLKAIQLIQQNDFQNAMKILVSNKQEMEKHNKNRSRLYYETMINLITIRYALTQLDQATTLIEDYKKGVLKHLGEASDLNVDGLLINGLCLLSDNNIDQSKKTQGLIDIRQACMLIKNTPVKQMYIRVICMQLLKEILKKKSAFKEIFYINTVLNSYYFQPRLNLNSSKDLLNAYNDNCKQLDLISEILSLKTVSEN